MMYHYKPIGIHSNQTHIEKYEEEDDSNRYDFIPFVKINSSEEPKSAIISSDECKNIKIEKIDLGKDYDSEHQLYSVANIVIAKNSISKIPLMLKRGYDPDYFQDDDGHLTYTTTNNSIRIKFIDNDDTDYEDGEIYDCTDASNGDEFVLEIDAKKLNRGITFSISFFASDNQNEGKNSSKRIGICGKLNFKIVEQDVFLFDEKEKVVEENSNLVHSDWNDFWGTTDKICFRVADKELAKLFNNKNIVLSNYNGENAYSRAITLKEQGYVFNSNKWENVFIGGGNIEPENYKISSKTFSEFIKKQVKNKIGYHVFYFSIIDANHVLLLVVDNTNPCNVRYVIFDQIRKREIQKINQLDNDILSMSKNVWKFILEKEHYKSKDTVQLWKLQRKK